MTDGDFERLDLTLGNQDEPGAWVLRKSEIRLLFHSFDHDVVRFEWFPGAQGELYTGVAGTSRLDDVRIRPVVNPPPSLLQAFALQQSQRDQEIDPRSVSVGATGNPLPLRRVTARDGVLLYDDATEVALWGVNIQTALSWEYNGRLRPVGVPHTAEALKEISARNLDHMPLLGVGVIRLHLLPADFSGPNGEICDTIYLDVLDDLLAQCRRRGLYVYLTLMNEMNTSFRDDSFVTGHQREEWVFDPVLVVKSQRYVHEFLNRTNPFWANPADLSVNNYLPYLQTCYRDYDYLRWMLGKRFKKKAKLAYEFESMYNHSAYLYPAMARLFRSLGAQIAPMWQYTLSPVAEYRAGSHYLNAYCTPRKAVSFRIASRVFASTPRYAPFELPPLDMGATTEMVGPNWAVSFDRDLSLWHSADTFLHSDEVDWNPLGVPATPATIAGCGNSPLVTYGGTGLYVLEFDGDTAELQILPDVRYTYPPWQQAAKSLRRVCELDAEAMHTFELHLEGWTDGVEVTRLEGAQTVLLPLKSPGLRFRAGPGQYRLTRGFSGHP